jgi:hypothetical protein
VDAVNGPVVLFPEVALAPVQPPLAWHAVAPAAVQLSVVDPPLVTVVTPGDKVRVGVGVGGGAGGAATCTVVVAEPVWPVLFAQSSV